MIRVMIVEDEAVIRKSIVSLMDWDRLGCQVVSVCKNGLEAEVYARNHPIDLVITDIKMPGMNGIELCRKLREMHASIEMIILSAYTEFHYAKEAMKYQVNDFIVKSEFIEELPKAVQQVVDKIKQKSLDQLEKEAVQLASEEIQRMVTKSILEGNTKDEAKIQDWLTAIQLQLEHYSIMLSSFGSISAKDKAIVVRIHDEAFRGHPVYIQWLDDHELLTLICIPAHVSSVSTAEIQSWLKQLCTELLTKIQQHEANHFSIGISLPQNHAQQIGIGYQQARTALNQIYQENGIHFYTEFSNDVLLRFDYGQFAEQLQLKLNVKNEQALLSYIDEVFTSIFTQITDIPKFKLEISMTIAKCIQALHIKRVDPVQLETIEQQFYAQLAQATSMKVISRWLCSTMQKMLHLNISHDLQAHHLVNGVRKYIHDHYQQAIHLDDIAEALHFNSSYVSRIYKKETSESIIQYLTRYRIERAKQLIDTSEHKIYKIGELVGIEDVSYFCSVFTKIVGVSPQKYRKSKRITIDK
jgi:two-component system response regulator YesN